MRFLVLIFTAVFCPNLFAETLFYQVHCVNQAGDEVRNHWIIGDKSSVTTTSGNQLLIQGAAVDLRKETQKVNGCTPHWGQTCWTEYNWGEASQVCGPNDKGWNVLVVHRTGGEITLFCGTGTSIESFSDKNQWVKRIAESVYDTSNRKGISKKQCLIEQTPLF